jgi:hypothetical protein
MSKALFYRAFELMGIDPTGITCYVGAVAFSNQYGAGLYIWRFQLSAKRGKRNPKARAGGCRIAFGPKQLHKFLSRDHLAGFGRQPGEEQGGRAR